MVVPTMMDYNTAMTDRPKKPLLRRRWPWVTLLLIAAFVLCIGPWPACPQHYDGTDYAAATFARIEALKLDAPPAPLSVGVARKDITPPAGEPMAGFSNRNPMTSEGVLEPIFAKAITLSAGGKTVTIVGGDILLFMPQLRDAVLARVKLPREDVYFTSTHTHSGPGGYSSRWVDRLVLGRYDANILNRLADSFAEVITQSRAKLTPASFTARRHLGDPRLDELMENRLDHQAGNSSLTILSMEDPENNQSQWRDGMIGRSLAMLVSFNGHPSLWRADNRRISGDYPGTIQQNIEEQYKGVCMFAAGPVGSMKISGGGDDACQKLMQSLSRFLYPGYPLTGEFDFRQLGPGGYARTEFGIDYRVMPATTVSLASAIVEVDLPPLQYPLGTKLRLSPVAASYLHGRRTYVHVLRIGNTVLLGMPCDYSGELAAELDAWLTPATGNFRQQTAIITSFNGDYIGYLTPQRRWQKASYETRDMSVFGPWCGEYFNEIARNIMIKTAAGGRPPMDGQDKSSNPSSN